MARTNPPTNQAPVPPIRVQNIQKGIERLGERINELQAFDLSSLRQGPTAALKGLEVSIRQTLERCFGESVGAD